MIKFDEVIGLSKLSFKVGYIFLKHPVKWLENIFLANGYPKSVIDSVDINFCEKNIFKKSSNHDVPKI